MKEANISYFPPVFHMSDVIMASPEAAMHWRKDLSQLHLFSSTSWLQHSWRGFCLQEQESLAFPLVVQYYYWISCLETEEKMLFGMWGGRHNREVLSYIRHEESVKLAPDSQRPRGIYPSGSGSKLQVHVLDQLLMLKCCRSQMSLRCPQSVTDYSETEELFEICHGPHPPRIIVGKSICHQT